MDGPAIFQMRSAEVSSSLLSDHSFIHLVLDAFLRLVVVALAIIKDVIGNLVGTYKTSWLSDIWKGVKTYLRDDLELLSAQSGSV